MRASAWMLEDSDSRTALFRYPEAIQLTARAEAEANPSNGRKTNQNSRVCCAKASVAEPVPDAPHRLDAACGGAEFSPQPDEPNVDRALRDA